MIVQSDVRTVDGMLLVSKGQEVSPPLILNLKNFHARRMIGAEVTISMPKTTLAFVKGVS